MQDVRGRWYIDYVGGAGALILGHAFPSVVKAVQEQAPKGLHFFGTLNESCVQLAKELVGAIPCAEKIAYTTTGSEATFYAMRIARAFTGRNKILKCEGGYHGNHDYSTFSVSPQAVSNYPAGRPDTAGMPATVAESVLVGPYNDLDTIRLIVEEERDDLAAIIVEPVQRVIFPKDGYLEGLRKICDENDVLFVTRVEHQTQINPSDGTIAYRNTFSARLYSTSNQNKPVVQYRPPRVTPCPEIAGAVTAFIEAYRYPETENSHAVQRDDLGRFNIVFQFDAYARTDASKVLHPVRAIQRSAGQRGASYRAQYSGTEVGIAFIDGDPDKPFVLGAFHNGIDQDPTLNWPRSSSANR